MPNPQLTFTTYKDTAFKGNGHTSNENNSDTEIFASFSMGTEESGGMGLLLKERIYSSFFNLYHSLG